MLKTASLFSFGLILVYLAIGFLPLNEAIAAKKSCVDCLEALGGDGVAKLKKYEAAVAQGERRLRRLLKSGTAKEQKAEAAKLIELYKADGRLQEAAWTANSVGDFKLASRLISQLEKKMENDPIDDMYLMPDEEKGVSKTYIVIFESGMKAIFKPVDTGWDGWASHFWHEIAAYQVSKLFGLNVVPVTVEATINGQRGSLQYFVRDAEPIPKLKYVPDRADPWRHKIKEKIRKFLSFDIKLLDHLIGNTDRNENNILRRRLAPWQQFAPDNSISFGVQAAYGSTPFPAEVPPTKRQFDLMSSVTKTKIREVLGPLLRNARKAYLRLPEHIRNSPALRRFSPLGDDDKPLGLREKELLDRQLNHFIETFDYYMRYYQQAGRGKLREK